MAIVSDMSGSGLAAGHLGMIHSMAMLGRAWSNICSRRSGSAAIVGVFWVPGLTQRAKWLLLAITAAIEVGSLIYRLVDRPSTPKPPLANLQIVERAERCADPFRIWNGAVCRAGALRRLGSPTSR